MSSSEDAAILLEFIQGDAGPDWKESQGWEETKDPCLWKGIECNSEKNVTSILLRGSDLVGTIPESIVRLEFLEVIELADNYLSGTIPSGIGNKLPSLVKLDLSSNSLTGTLPKLLSPMLEKIVLSFNELSGELPDTFRTLPRCDRFKINHNNFYGTLPPSFTKMKELRTLNMGNNKFSGTIPKILGDLPNLIMLHLNDNNFKGRIPLTITRDWLSFQKIHLQGNNLSGSLPADLANLPNLQELFIGDNRIIGTVPKALCEKGLNKKAYGSDDDTDYFNDSQEDNTIFFDDVVEDTFVGADKEKIPDELTGDVLGEVAEKETGNLTPLDDVDEADTIVDKYSPDKPKDVLYDELLADADEENKYGNLTGKRPQKWDDDVRKLEDDKCMSVACPAGYQSTKEFSNLGVSPCEKCEEEDLNTNLGAIRCKGVSAANTLKEFYHATDGDNWSGDTYSWIDDDVPVCKKHGISCDSYDKIVAIRLPDMNLRGTIIEDIGNFYQLQVLDLSDNFIRGTIPSQLGALSLRTLDLSGNFLTGVVPEALCQMRGVNENGKKGPVSCDTVACPIGTFSFSGYAPPGSSCMSCHRHDKTTYLGSKKCLVFSPEMVQETNHISQGGLAFLWFVGMVVVAGLLLLFEKTRDTNNYFDDEYKPDVTRIYKSVKESGQCKSYDDHSTSDESGFNSSYASKSMPPPSDAILRGTFPGVYDDELAISGKQTQKTKKSSGDGLWLDVPTTFAGTFPGGPVERKKNTNSRVGDSDDDDRSIFLDVPEIDM